MIDDCCDGSKLGSCDKGLSLGLNIQGWGFKVQGTGCRGFRGVWGSRFRGFRAWRVGGGSV